MYPVGIDLWAPIMMSPQLDPKQTTPFENRRDSYLQVVGRLRPGVSLQQAQARRV